jgi:hypothetical protein
MLEINDEVLCVQATPFVDVANFPSYPTAIIMLEFAYRPLIKVVPNEEVLCTQVIPSIDVASFPEPPTAIHKDADVEYTTPRIVLAPNDEERGVQVMPSTEVDSFPELPPIT